MPTQMCNGEGRGVKGGLLFQSLLLGFLGGFPSFPTTLLTLGETKMAEQSNLRETLVPRRRSGMKNATG